MLSADFKDKKKKEEKRIIFSQITFVVKHLLLRWAVFSAPQH